MSNPIYVILGPTGSGKSALALSLAHSVSGEIINADALQVYADLEVLSARPCVTDMQDIKHYLYGYKDAYSSCSVADWLQDAKEVLNTVKTPVFVGGTGMYLSSLINGVSPIPDIDPLIREQVRQMDIQSVQSQVQDKRFSDPQRLRRALEVELSTGKTLSYFQSLEKIKITDRYFKIFFVNPPRDVLYDRCNKRFLKMIESGAIDEVKHLEQIHATGGVLKAIGVKEIKAYLQGEMSFDMMIEKASQATRNYAKRQVTWFKNQIKDAVCVTDSEHFVF